MPSCSANNCSNRYEQGFRLFRFPANEERREIWIQRCGHSRVTAHSRLCEYHFDDTCFENKRADGKRMLKFNAVPTIFIQGDDKVSTANNRTGDILPKFITFVKDTQRNECSDNVNKYEDRIAEEITLENNIVHEHERFFKTIKIKRKNIRSASMSENGSTQTEQSLNTEDIHGKIIRDDELQTSFFPVGNGSIHQANEIKRLRTKLKQAFKKEKCNIQKINMLQEKLDHSSRVINLYQKYYYQNKCLTKTLKKMPTFNTLLSGIDGPRRKWSEESLKLATQIKDVVGLNAYCYLQNDLRFPLPSYSILCRYNKQNHSSADTVDEDDTLLEIKPESQPFTREHDYAILEDRIDDYLHQSITST